MTLRFSVNNKYSANTGNDVIFDFKQFMKSASPSGPGWSIVSSGDGLAAFSSTGDIITTASSGAGGLDNTGAWFVLRCPDGLREFLWQRGTNSGSWLILYSRALHFSGGNATTRAAALDAGVVLGSTDVPASAVASTHLNNNTLGVITHYCADDADGYSFYYFGYLQGTLASAYGGLVFDELQDGTFQDGYEEDPRIIYVAAGASNNNWSNAGISSSSTNTTFGRCVGYMFTGTIYETFGTISGIGYVSDVGTGTPPEIPPLGGTNLFSLKDQLLPIFYLRINTLSGGTGFKGAGKNMKWKSNNRGTAQTLSLNSSNDHIVINTVVLPFNGSEPIM